MAAILKIQDLEKIPVTLPVTRFFAICVSLLALFGSMAISYATYKEQFHQVQVKLEKQQTINEKTQEQIIQLQIVLARLQGAIEKNTKVIENANSR